MSSSILSVHYACLLLEARGMLMPYHDTFFRFDRMLLVTSRKLHEVEAAQ